MSKTFTTNLVGRRFTPIPPRTKPNWHVRDDLPQGIVYLVHTAYLDESLPTVVGERIDVVGAAVNTDVGEMFRDAPQSMTVAVAHFGVLWELLPA
jgi:hypothetical protein